MSSDERLVTCSQFLAEAEDSDVLVMGGCDGEPTCTFPRGYLKRQAVYVCKTCAELTHKRAGICYECSLQCHSDHEVVELYTKRNFRCDCGNSRFGGAVECSLWEEKDDENIENRYNHNFDGLFCTCLKPYPDPDAEVEHEMFQCGICEDWYHLQHLGGPADLVAPEDYEELTCYQCVKRLPILWVYHYAIANNLMTIPAEVSDNCTVASDCDVSTQVAKRPKFEDSVTISSAKPRCTLSNHLNDLKLSSSCPSPAELQGLSISDVTFPSCIFWPSGWRELLCPCEECAEACNQLQVMFLLDAEDSISNYMKVGRNRVNKRDEDDQVALNKFLAELPRSAAVTIATGFTKLKTAIHEFLAKSREEGHVITEAEMKEFCKDLKRDFI